MSQRSLTLSRGCPAATALILLSGCQGGVAERSAPEHRDSSGVDLVFSGIGAEPRELPWTIDSARVVPAGIQNDSVTEYEGAGFAFRLPSGKLVIVHGQPRIMVFDSTGRFLNDVSRGGKGPGELAGLDYVGPGQGDSIVVFAGVNGILTFSSDGKLGSAVRPERPLQGVMGRFEDGSFLAFDPTAGPEQTVEGWAVIRGDGTVSPPFGMPRQIETPPDRPSAWGPGRGLLTGKKSFYKVDGATGEIKAYAMNGALLRVIRPELKLRGPTDQEIDRWKSDTSEFESMPPAARQQAKAEKAKVAFPDLLPALDGPMVVDALDNLWVRRHRTFNDLPQQWLVFNPRGECIGQMTLPSNWWIFQIGIDFMVVGVDRDWPMTLRHVKMFGLERDGS